jgi:hypothetical protein
VSEIDAWARREAEDAEANAARFRALLAEQAESYGAGFFEAVVGERVVDGRLEATIETAKIGEDWRALQVWIFAVHVEHVTGVRAEDTRAALVARHVGLAFHNVGATVARVADAFADAAERVRAMGPPSSAR